MTAFPLSRFLMSSMMTAVMISDLLRWSQTGRVFRRRNGWRWTMKTKRHRPSRNIIIIALGIIIITIFIITITITRVVAGLLLSNLMSLLLGAGIGICIYRRFLSIFDSHHFLHLLVVVSLIWTWKDILKPRSWRLFFPGPGRAIWTCDYSDSVIPCNICCQMLAEFNTVTQIHCSILQRKFICQGDRRNLITKIEHLKQIRPCSSRAWANQAKLYQTNKTQQICVVVCTE